MAYTVNKTDTSATPNSYTVQDSVLNTQTDLNFVGKGYAGYGEIIAENFLHLLENFADQTAPAKPIIGQLWYDKDDERLKVYTGSSFAPTGGARFQADAPSAQVAGDIWIDSDTQQMFFYNGSSNVLVGPPSATGTTNGFTYETIQDSTDANQNITNLYNDGTRIAIISEDSFTPKVSISGFTSITAGINLSTAVSGNKFTGTATNADTLGGIAAANFLRSNANDTTTGTIGIVNDSGLSVGSDNDLRLTVDSSGAIISNVVVDTDITFKVNDGGTTTTVMTIDGDVSRVGIGTTTPSTKLQVNGTTTSTAFAGPLTGNVTGNITSSGTSTFTTLNMSGTLTSQLIRPATDATYDIGTSSLKYNTVYAKATSAQYADLAEKYLTDQNYAAGTVVKVGGEFEVNWTYRGEKAIGVISTNPAYMMNSDLEGGQYVALKGRVPVKVIGPVRKGQRLIPDDKGVATVTKEAHPDVFAIALQDNYDQGVKLIEAVVL